ncbi:MAG: L-threonine dehydratase catabolic TdcB [Anaerolineae bacterium]|nr:L-threonine dehydratase catabolic TdcB [Anaerolineae bacterium]
MLLMFQRPPTLIEIWRAHTRLRAWLTPTPLRKAFALSEQCAAEIFLKLENWQPTGSFKVRGAFNLLAQLTPSEIARGLVAASAGNHGSAVGYAAQRLGIANVHIFAPTTTPRAKIAKMQRLGVNVHEVGATYDDAHHAAAAFQHAQDATFVHAYDDARTVAGAGACALEILETAQTLDAVLIPVGGGGLSAGMAIAFKQLAPHIQVVGIQPEASPSLRDSLRDQICYEEYNAAPTLCDGLAGGIGKIVFEVAQKKWIDQTLLVSERAVARAVAEFARREQLMVEGSGAVGLAALLENPERWRGQRVGLVVSGANIDAARLRELLTED